MESPNISSAMTERMTNIYRGFCGVMGQLIVSREIRPQRLGVTDMSWFLATIKPVSSLYCLIIKLILNRLAAVYCPIIKLILNRLAVVYGSRTLRLFSVRTVHRKKKNLTEPNLYLPSLILPNRN